ncbi:DUF222 domain-containing protein [Microbacter sp. GSS18]|nr:DUF222 domain-containing protein [Microbacter sp. GSS18]
MDMDDTSRPVPGAGGDAERDRSPIDPAGADPFWSDEGDAFEEDAVPEWSPEPPDAVGRVVEAATVMASFAVDRLMGVDRMRQEAFELAAQRGGRFTSEIVLRSVRLELAAALRISEYAAGRMIGLAEALVHRYRSALTALMRAEITETHAEILVDAIDAVEPEHRNTILPRAVELARVEPVGVFRRALRALIDDARGATLAERHDVALRRRRVVVEPADDGMAWLMTLMPAVEAHAVQDRLTRMAKAIRRVDGEDRSLDQIRADAVGDLLIEGDTSALPERARGIRASVVVTVPALSLLGAAAGSGMPVVEGVGPIPVERARELCGGDGAWLRVLTHPETGAVLSVGRERYDPPPTLRKLTRWRADRCMAPGCGVPASRCELDHTLAWEHGGATALENLAPVCKGHHTLKHHGGWRVEQVGGGGALRWTSPAGRRYRVEPERRVPVFRSADASDAPF